MGQRLEGTFERQYQHYQQQHSHQHRRNASSRSPPRGSEASTSYLDGLRGLAALFVFIQHYIGAFDANVHEHGFGENGNYYLASFPFLRIIFSGGNAGVSIFFVLSGYVLSKAPLRLIRDERFDACRNNLISAILRRPVRLYLPPLIITGAHAILMHAPFGIVPFSAFNPPQNTLFAQLSHWLSQFIRFFNPFQTHGSNRAWFNYNLVMWTIPIELKGSMLTYALAGLCALAPDLIPPLATALILTVFAGSLLQIGIWTMACFMLGLALSLIDTHALDATVFHALHLSSRAQSLVRHAAFIVGFYLLCQPAHAGNPEYSRDAPGWGLLSQLTPAAYDKTQYYHFWQSWGALLAVYGALRLPWLQEVLGSRPLRYLGRVSFMLYLVHLPMLSALGDRVARMFGQVYMGAEPTWWDNRLWVPDIGPKGMSVRFLLSMAVTLPVTLVLADFCTRTVDMPSVRLGKRLVHRLGLDSTSQGSVMLDLESGKEKGMGVVVVSPKPLLPTTARLE